MSGWALGGIGLEGGVRGDAAEEVDDEGIVPHSVSVRFDFYFQMGE